MESCEVKMTKLRLRAGVLYVDTVYLFDQGLNVHRPENHVDSFFRREAKL